MPEMEEFIGLGASDGVAISRAVCLASRVGDIFQIPLQPAMVEEEIERFRRAVRETRDEIHRLRARVGEELGEDLASIFDAQALFLSDEAFIERVLQRIREEQINAEWAVHETAGEIQARFAAIDHQYFRERGEDLRDVCHHLVRRMQGLQLHELSELPDAVVIVADDLTPSDAVRLGRENVAGFVIEHGSRTSHTTIIARSLNIPLVTGVAGVTRRLADQAEVPIIVDGTRGRVVLRPDAATRALYEGRREEDRRREEELLAAAGPQAVTRDGVEVQVMANIDLPEEIDEARRYGAAGVGLYRSEFLYIEKSPAAPSEDEHVEIYRRLLEAAAPFPAVIRTYDLGGRKVASELFETREANPVLGLRGIRLTLARPAMFRTQLRALFRASVYGDLWIMLPMVSIVEEVRAYRAFAAEVMDELEAEGLPIRRDHKTGIMIEVPSAAIISDILAREVDFFSIGTNDLIQYSLAVDRANEHVADLYRPLHPGILRMLRMVVDNAAAAGIEVSLCGEMAAEAKFLPVLVGCGLRRISVSPRRIPAIKRLLLELDTEVLRQAVEHCSGLATGAEVEAYLRSVVPADDPPRESA